MTDIKFTKKQFQDLLILAYIGNWVINSHRGDQGINQFNELEEYLFSKTPLFGLEKFADDDDPEDGIPSQYFQDHYAQDHIVKFEEDTLWDQLSERMAHKQIASMYTEDQLQRMDPRERWMIHTALVKKFAEEFSENGVNNLILQSPES